MTAPTRERASAVCVHEGRLLCVRMRDPSTRVVRLFVPGGAVEAGETAVDAAVRETLEETGYRVIADATRSRVARYPYVWDGVARDVTTHFFAATLADAGRPPAHVRDADYNEGVEWLPLGAVAERLGFQREILAAVVALLP